MSDFALKSCKTSNWLQGINLHTWLDKSLTAIHKYINGLMRYRSVSLVVKHRFTCNLNAEENSSILLTTIPRSTAYERDVVLVRRNTIWSMINKRFLRFWVLNSDSCYWEFPSTHWSIGGCQKRAPSPHIRNENRQNDDKIVLFLNDNDIMDNKKTG